MYFFYFDRNNFLVPFLLFISALTNIAFAQQPSFGAGIGINSLRLVKQNSEGTTTNLSPLQVSLNIDYNFPNQTNIKWLKKTYNSIFSDNKFQLRTQVIINQFRIESGVSNSITSIGASMLYFPFRQETQKKVNSFAELGYKGGWSNVSNNPFHGIVFGIGSRYSLENEWLIQLNLSYTMAFNDYLDKMGVRGLNWGNRDGYFLANVSLLKVFYSQTTKKQIDLARDSLAMSKTLAFNVLQKSTSLLERIKLFNEQLQEKEEKAKENLETVLKLEDAMKNIAQNLQTARLNKANSFLHEKIEQEIEGLRTQFSMLDIRCFFEYESVSNELTTNAKKNIDIFHTDFQQDITITKQLLWQSKEFIPKNKQFRNETNNLSVINEANMLLSKCETEATLIQTRLQQRQILIKKILGIFEKVNANKKIIGEDLEQFVQEMQKGKSGY